MRIRILAGSPYGTCENDAFSQVNLESPVRCSHCVNKAPASNAKLDFFFKYLANEKDLDHEQNH
jgi:hypothetical protein